MLKKTLKILFITTLLLIISISIAVWYLFEPDNLTSIINKQAKKYLKCETEIKKVEPTLFGSFPFFGVEITDLCLREKSSSDTIVYAKKCTASIDIKSFLLDDNIILKSFYLENGYMNVEIDTNNNINLDILKVSSNDKSTDETGNILPYENIKLNNIIIKNFEANFIDHSSLIKSSIENLNINLFLEYSENKLVLNSDIGLDNLYVQIQDSIEIYTDIKNAKVKLSLKGSMENTLEADLNINMPEILLLMAKDTLLSKMKFSSHIPFSVNINKKKLNLKNSEFNFNNHKLFIEGDLNLQNENSFSTDIKYRTTNWDLTELIALIPKAYSSSLKGVHIVGVTQVNGSIEGLYSNNSFPLISVDLKYNKGELKYLDNPTLSNISTSLSVLLDLNEGHKSNLSIHEAEADVLGNNFIISGMINDFMGKPVYDIKANAKVDFSSLKSYVPQESLRSLKGFMHAKIHTKFSQYTLDNKKYHRIYLSGNVDIDNLDVNVNDTMKLNIPKLKVELKLPSHKQLNRNNLLANINLDADLLDIIISPGMTAQTKNLKAQLSINDIIEGVSAPITSISFKLENMYARADTISINTKNSSGKFIVAPRLKNKTEVIDIEAEIKSNSISLISKDTVMFDVNNFYTKTNLQYDTLETNLISQWKPRVEMIMSDARFNLGGKLKGSIPNTSFTLTPEKMIVKKANVILGNSDFNLTGEFSNLTKFLDHDALLKGEFDFVSEKTDIMELMDIFNGMGTEQASDVNGSVETSTVEEKNIAQTDPFMVPKGVDIRLNTTIKKSIINEHSIENIKGALTIKDGTLILEQVGFTSKAANMQLTAIYKSARRNHLFTSIDFHLLNIDISELVSLIPYIETINPMITSFDGQGNFHLAAETYLKSDYSLKNSTIRGAAAFEGENLILMDNETFSSMANMLMFEKKTANKINKLSVEMTVFRDEIDLYPFLLKMDDYSAVISGQVNMDEQINYHVSVTDSPLPFRLGLNINGTIDNPTFKLASCKYKYLYSPQKQSGREKQILRLKKMISDALKANVKPIE